MKNTFENIEEVLGRLNLPQEDRKEFVPSQKRFEDGASYRIEIPTVNSEDSLDALLNESLKIGLTINRITETRGIFRYNNESIKKYVSLCKQYGCQLLMSPGPRAPYDIGASARTQQGNYMAYRLRGQNQIKYALSDVLRGIELGVKGFVLYDEGLLYILNQMRENGDIPKDVFLKTSAHCGYANPTSIRLLEKMGANSVNPVRDLSMEMLYTIRQAVSIPMDCHVDNPPSSGGMVRFYDAPYMVMGLAPVFIKTGNSLLPAHGVVLNKEQAKEIAKQALAVKELIQYYAPDAKQSEVIHRD